MRGATPERRAQKGQRAYFNPRTPCGVRLQALVKVEGLPVISIHAPHAGCDQYPPCRNTLSRHISIHAPHAGCDDVRFPGPGFSEISIHAPHAGCDIRPLYRGRASRWISIHAPHAGCDSEEWQAGFAEGVFQSTHPMRGATYYDF